MSLQMFLHYFLTITIMCSSKFLFGRHILGLFFLFDSLSQASLQISLDSVLFQAQSSQNYCISLIFLVSLTPFLSFPQPPGVWQTKDPSGTSIHAS